VNTKHANEHGQNIHEIILELAGRARILGVGRNHMRLLSAATGGGSISAGRCRYRCKLELVVAKAVVERVGGTMLLLL
jgi:hypothetical protein